MSVCTGKKEKLNKSHCVSLDGEVIYAYHLSV